MTGGRDLTPAERGQLAEALLTWRYVDHAFSSAGITTEEADRRCYTALRLAKAVGARDEYLALVFAHPVLEVTVREYDEEHRLKKFVGQAPPERRRGKGSRR